MLLDYWDGACAVTGITEPELLRASHAKPWRDATDAERLDPYNGFLLTVHLDAMFDSGLMSFADDGAALLSPSLTASTQLVFGFQNLQLRRVAPPHARYLQYHRQRRFRRGSSGNTT